jgi:hypothetical protein
MKRTDRHVGKSFREREYYSKKIRGLDYEPTIDETLKFDESDESKKDFSLPTTRATRPRKVSERITDHLKENWIAWIFALIGLTIVYYGFTFNRALGTLEGIMGELRDTVKNMHENFKGLDDKFHSHDLEIQKNSLKIEQIERDIHKKGRVD